MVREYTQNRELSWLKFNERVLDEASDETVPLLERLKFVSIFTSNLDEFFMIRVGSLTELMNLKESSVDNKSGMNAEQQLAAIYDAVGVLYEKRERIYEDLEKQLRVHGIYNLSYKELEESEKKQLKKYFGEYIEPVLSPQIVDEHHPFPHLANKTVHIGAMLDAKNHDVFAVIPVPAIVPPILYLKGDDCRYIRTEEVIAEHLGEIFSNYRIKEKVSFCVTRNADINPGDEEFDFGADFRKKMKKVLKQRARLGAVRLELSNNVSNRFLHYLIEKIGILPKQVYITRLPFKMDYVFGLEGQLTEDKALALSYSHFTPQKSPQLDMSQSIIKQIRQKDVVLSYPYQSMDPFVQLLKEASVNSSVVSIKITIYRLASHAKIVEYLCQAAENGKDVTVIIELRARFDEQNNIDWSKQLESAGCTVIYGFDDYKVHSKLTLITSKVNGKYHYLTQIGTGNYNEKTSELYTDLSFITTRQEIGEEASAVFNNMALQRLTSEADTMLVAPLRFKSVLLEQMDRQIDRARRGLPASMILKNNSINDPQIINKISEASCAGVRVDMIVRGICCIKAGVPGKTENVHIRSIVGRYLEHSRIYCFGEGEDMTIYIASGDFLTRNTERRVEVGVRVDDREIAKKLRGILDLQLRDTVNAREMQPDGIYTRVKPKQGEPPVDSQMAMYGYFQHGFETAHPAAPTRKAAAKPVQKPKRPTPYPHKPENKRFRGFLDSLFGHKK